MPTIVRYFGIMGYLRSRDYDKQIQQDNLSQIISNDPGIRLLAEAAAEEECISYLIQKYDTDKEFNGVVVWSPLYAYDVEQLVELNYPVYSPANSYLPDDLITYNGYCYICANPTTGAFVVSDWTIIGVLYDLFYAVGPCPTFNLTQIYNTGDRVFWKGNYYTCIISTFPPSQNDLLQLGQYQNVPNLNIFPDDVKNGLQYWGAPTAYVVSAGTLPNTPLYWTKGDNRSQQLVMTVVDVTLYHVHSRIAPRNIPQLRQDRYDRAIDWLNKANAGKVTAKITKIQPAQGRAIRFGGNIKNINTY